MRIGIIGDDLMGSSLAYFLSRQHTITLLDQSTQQGFINSAVTFDGVQIARYQQAILPTDSALRALCDTLGLSESLLFGPAKTGFVHENRVHNMSALWDFLTFMPLRLRDRLRLARTILQAWRIQDPRTLDNIPVSAWLERYSGKITFDRIWRPLLEAKFDNDYRDVPATFIWAWLRRMTVIRRNPSLQSKVGYLRHGQAELTTALHKAIQAHGGTVITGSAGRVREIEVSAAGLGRIRTYDGLHDFDCVIAALPTPAFAHLIPAADDAYLAELQQVRYLGLVCPMLILDRPLTDYWTLNLTDATSPFSSIIETPHPENPDYHIVYLPKYTAAENDWFGVPDADIRTAWLGHLYQIFPALRQATIHHCEISRLRYVEPVHPLNAYARLTPTETPYAGLHLVNSSQIYPEHPSSNATVRFAQRVAQHFMD